MLQQPQSNNDAYFQSRITLTVDWDSAAGDIISMPRPAAGWLKGLTTIKEVAVSALIPYPLVY